MLWQAACCGFYSSSLKEDLSDVQSFFFSKLLFLFSVSGLAVLADSFPEQILQRLLGEYQTGATVSSPKRERSLETRLKVGEVLMRASRAMGEHSNCLSVVFLSFKILSFNNHAPFQDLFVRSGQCHILNTSVLSFIVSQDHSVWVWDMSSWPVSLTLTDQALKKPHSCYSPLKPHNESHSSLSHS